MSFEPWKSETELFDEAFSEKRISYKDIDGDAICHGTAGTWFSYTHGNELMLVCLQDDGSIVRKDVVTMDQPGRVIEISEDNGTLYAAIMIDRFEDVLAIKDGKIESVTHLPTDLEAGIYCEDPKVIDQTIYTLCDGQIQAIDLQGEVKKQREIEEIVEMTVNQESIFCLSYFDENGEFGQFKITQMDRETWKEKKTVIIDGTEELDYDIVLFAGNTETELYLYSTDGVFRCDMETGELKMVLNTVDYDVDIMLIEVTDSQLLYETSFRKIGEREEFQGLVRSRIDLSGSSKKVIRAGVLWAESDYYPLIAAYNRSHTDSFCEIVDYREQIIGQLIGSSGSSGDAATVTAADVKRACLSILTNQDGIDLVILPNYYAQAFAKSQLLLDLRSDLDGVGNMVPGILDASLSDGKQYFVTPFYGVKVNSYAGNVYQAEDTHFENALSNPEAKRLIQEKKVFEETVGKIQEELRKTGGVSEDTLTMFFRLYDFEKNGYYQEDLLIDEIRSGRVLCMDSSIWSFEQFMSLYSYFDGEYAYTGSWGYDTPAAMAETYLGISAKTKNKDAAVEVLKFLLSYDVQYTYAGTDWLGFPMNQDALSGYFSYETENLTEEEKDYIYSEFAHYSDYDEDRAEEEIDRIMNEHYSGNSGSGQEPMDAPVPKGIRKAETKADLEEIRDVLFAMISETKEYYLLDETIQMILEEETAAYFQGNRSEQDCISTIKNRLDLYYSEQMS